MILDTCALIWLAEGGRHLTPAAKEAIADVPTLYISAITGFEVGVKHAQRKLELPVAPAEWLAGVLSHHDIDTLDLSLDVCVAAAGLPPIHRDPADRFILATAKLSRLPIITADERFSTYGVEVIW